MKYNTIRPGQVWLDTEGKRIQAHGGSLFYENETYYWYGENKEKTDGKNGIWHLGVRCYSSKDMYNWKDLGNIIEPESDPESSLHPSSMMDRPHIIYNKQTGKYVCWLKIMHRDGTQDETVLTADRLTGPYTKVREGIRPLNMNAGDFDLVVAPDGKAYYYFERVHSETICADLTADYTDVTGFYSTQFPRPCPPYVREATAYFNRRGKHYLLTSGTTGYNPNPSEVAIGDTYHGPFRVLGNPHADDKSDTSFHSQISSVFKVPNKKDLYIACADRWIPKMQGVDYTFYGKVYEYIFSGRTDEIDKLAKEFQLSASQVEAIIGDQKRNTSIADYVWLPLCFTEVDEQHPEGMVRIDWHEEWKLEDYK